MISTVPHPASAVGQAAGNVVDQSTLPSWSRSRTVIAPAVGVDVNLAKVLVSLERGRVGARRGVDEHRLRPERTVKRVRAERTGVGGAGDELPERREVADSGAGRILVVGGGVMHVGGEQHDAGHAPALGRAQDLGELQLAQRQVIGDYLPGRVPSRSRSRW
jgi:hypothetical protein